MYKIGLIFFAAVLLITALLGCSQSEPTQEVKAPDNVDALAEGLLQAFNLGDYGIYAGNFDANANLIMSEDWFGQTVSLIQQKVGYYVTMSKELKEVKPGDVYTDVIYKTKFSDEPDDVYVTIAYYVSDNHTYAAGIWFNSPKLFAQ